MALRYGFPTTDNLLCSNLVCKEKATCIVHMKDETEKFFCREHFPMSLVGDASVDRVEELRQAGERNAKPAPVVVDEED